MAKITINGVTLDPLAEAPMLAQHALISPDASRSDYLLVQVRKPLDPDERGKLQGLGVELLEVVPDDTYVCRYQGSDLGPIRALPFVAWVNVYLKAFKIAPELHAAATGTRAPLHTLLGQPSTPGSSAALVNIVLQRGADEDSARQAISQATGLAVSALQPSRGKFRVRLQPDRLAALASVDEVRNIEPVHEKQLWNNVARGIIGADPVSAGVALQGQGQIVAVCDTGFDLGQPQSPHPAFEGRVLKLYALGRHGDASDPNGHGTHVCGSVLGDGASGSDGAIRGTAPRAKLVMQSVLDAKGGLGGLPDDLTELFQPAYADGARVHSNSWGDDDNGYPSDSHDVDDFVWNQRDMVIVIAAGNSGRDGEGVGSVDPNSVGSPGTAKNGITVGACENERPTFAYVDGDFTGSTYGDCWAPDFPVAPINGDPLANNPEGLAAFSSRGPTKDGRLKPDVVAPGTAILSTRSRAPGVGNGWGPSGDKLYFYDGGTSMATPLVAGCAAVVREYLLGRNAGTPPSAALVKALLINGADPLKGQYSPSELGTIPNRNEGFGRVNLAASVDARQGSHLLQYWDEAQALDAGQAATFNVSLAAPATTVKVTLVWTDPAGEGLQNDLDLVVSAGGGQRGLGNASPGSTTPDRKNNVEQVVLGPVPAGQLTIQVSAYRIAIQPQSFALVVRAID